MGALYLQFVNPVALRVFHTVLQGKNLSWINVDIVDGTWISRVKRVGSLHFRGFSPGSFFYGVLACQSVSAACQNVDFGSVGRAKSGRVADRPEACFAP